MGIICKFCSLENQRHLYDECIKCYFKNLSVKRNKKAREKRQAEAIPDVPKRGICENCNIQYERISTYKGNCCCLECDRIAKCNKKWKEKKDKSPEELIEKKKIVIDCQRKINWRSTRKYWIPKELKVMRV